MYYLVISTLPDFDTTEEATFGLVVNLMIIASNFAAQQARDDYSAHTDAYEMGKKGHQQQQLLPLPEKQVEEEDVTCHLALRNSTIFFNFVFLFLAVARATHAKHSEEKNQEHIFYQLPYH